MYLMLKHGIFNELSKITSIDYTPYTKVLEVHNEKGNKFIIDPKRWFRAEKYFNTKGEMDGEIFAAEIRVGSKTYAFLEFNEDEVLEFAKGEGMDKEFFEREEE